MKTFLHTIALLCIMAQITFGQTDREKAFAKGGEAVRLMDNGKIEESIKLLEEAVQLDPGSAVYPYEIAYARYVSGDYKGAIIILDTLVQHSDAEDHMVQLLGNSYDNAGEREKAIEIYQNGLKQFPHSGSLHLELGNMFIAKEEYDKAVSYYENGIKEEPGFSSNYYWAAKLYCNSAERVWGMIYGELFMNLERNTKRTEEISKLLYDTYKAGIQVGPDMSSYSVDFTRIGSKDGGHTLDRNNIPFGAGAYELTLGMSVTSEKIIDLNTLDHIRQNFIDLYYNAGRGNGFPNVLFDYQNEVLKAGYLEAYNHWVLMKGDEVAFTQWQQANQEKWEKFTAWFATNGLKLDDHHKFYREQY